MLCVCVYGKQGRHELKKKEKESLRPLLPQDDDSLTHTQILLHNNNKHESSSLHTIPMKMRYLAREKPAYAMGRGEAEEKRGRGGGGDSIRPFCEQSHERT